MHLVSKIIIQKPLDEVWKFFQDPYSLAKWDHSVETVVPTTKGSVRLGYTFDTIAPVKPGSTKEGMRLHYEIIEFEPRKQVKIALKDSSTFKEAVWQMEFEVTPEGTQVACHVVFTPWLRYLFLVPLMWVNRRAIFRDLGYLKEELEKPQ
ncbi:MAG TPA: SRPBCC family protein [Methylomirabilota bacterium]|nr:SRPBCC family protein [Methylomirabilota bacterium]